MMKIPLYIKSQDLQNDLFPYFMRNTRLYQSISMHRHDFIEMEFVLSGYGRQIVNGFEYELKSGSLNIILPWHMHEIIPASETPLEMVSLSFGLDALMDSNPCLELGELLFNDMDSLPYVHFEGLEYEYINGAINELLIEYADIKQWKKTIFEVKIAEILVLFNRKRREQSVSEDTALKLQKNISIWDIISFIHFNYNKDISLTNLADKFHYSKSHLNMLIKHQTGSNFNDLLDEIRIRNVCALMLSGLSFSHIALLVGYKNKQAFFRAFKKIKCLAPEDFRKVYFSNNITENNLTFSSNIYSQLIYYLHLHYKEELTLEDIASQLHYNKNYFCNLVKVQTGQSFIDLLHQIRIFHACSLLKATDKPIYEIGFDVGFNTIETFFRVFKSLKGISPGKYRSVETNINEAESQEVSSLG
ncbi:helix-turn-helix domain-containing protein [Anaerocolumna chitinilytica]|uniref:HTH araC/xylS-type domain-containing protein n=1 Tax=Anaerocolumna chitinilytica TaxID=1727145 RepID=A0A7I8DMI4_9FIRM|nr:helix-turn-helix domain-containing protein [Anaerocolumna chitinilytica]BCJ98501.1 hypothetical protein bsdcttw_15420 [Anaerocolumna chitinilytica]